MKFTTKMHRYQIKENGALNHNYNLLSKKKKALVKRLVKKYHAPVAIAIQVVYFFGNNLTNEKINMIKWR